MFNNSVFVNKKWYRRLYGGTWHFIKIGKDTPYINMFSTWINDDPKFLDGHIEVLSIEKYPKTNINSNWDLCVLFIKQMFNKDKKPSKKINKESIPKDIEKWMDSYLKF